MAIRLAKDLSTRIAAIAPVAAQVSGAIEGESARRAVSVMFVNGTNDPLVPLSVSRDINASEMILEFLLSHSR